MDTQTAASGFQVCRTRRKGIQISDSNTAKL